MLINSMSEELTSNHGVTNDFAERMLHFIIAALEEQAEEVKKLSIDLESALQSKDNEDAVTQICIQLLSTNRKITYSKESALTLIKILESSPLYTNNSTLIMRIKEIKEFVQNI